MGTLSTLPSSSCNVDGTVLANSNAQLAQHPTNSIIIMERTAAVPSSSSERRRSSIVSGRSWSSALLLLLLTLLLSTLSQAQVSSTETTQLKDTADDFRIFVTKGKSQAIRLKSRNALYPGHLHSMPIEVPESKISIDGKRAPRLRAITSPNKTINFGVGDDVHINLEFYYTVLVHGEPTVTMNTGCRTEACSIAEVQSFSCLADSGMFSMRLENQLIMNIDVNTTKEQLKTRLEELDGIHEVTVRIDSNSEDPLYQNRMCSGVGNNVTIAFNHSHFPQHNGDVPTMQLDAQNDDVDLRTLTSQGSQFFLTRSNLGKKVFLSNTTMEIVRGVNRTDTKATYLTGNGTNTITFLYEVENGDIIASLDVVSIDFDHGYISSKFGGNVSTDVPVFGSGPRYMSSAPAALSFNEEIIVSSDIPYVVSLTSPNVSAVYTAGDVVLVDVNFDIPFKLSNPELLSLELATGIFTRRVPFEAFIIPSTLRFKYEVMEEDSSGALDVTNSAAFYLNGGRVFRGGFGNQVDAIVTLPLPGDMGSLSASKVLTINTLSPVVITVTSLVPAGSYTAGDLIDFEVLYNTPISVTGNPRFLVQNDPRLMEIGVRTAPHQPEFSYSRSLPGGIAQVLVKATVNWDLVAGDKIFINLPNIYIRDIDITQPRITTVTAYGDYSFTGTFNDVTKILTLVSQETLVDKFTPIELLIEGRSSLFVVEEGLFPQKTEKLSFDASNVLLAYSTGFDFEGIQGVGFDAISAVLWPAQFDRDANMRLDLVVPERWTHNDTITLHLAGMAYGSTDSIGMRQASGTNFAFKYSANDATLELRVLELISSNLSFSFNISELVPIKLPEAGLKSKTSIAVSMNSANNGQLDKAVIISNAVCDANVATTFVHYETVTPSAKSKVRFAWSTGLHGLLAGDQVEFLLANLASTVVSARQIDNYFVEGALKSSFQVEVKPTAVVFHVTTDIAASQAIVLSVSDDALLVPGTGVSNSDTFDFLVQSVNCEMASPRSLSFATSALVLGVSQATVTLSTTALDTVTSIDIDFTVLSSGLKAGDQFVVSLPGFRHEYAIGWETTFVTSNAQVSVKHNQLEEQLEFTVLVDFITLLASSKLIHVTVSSSAQFYTPTTGVHSDSFKLAVTSASFGRLSNFLMQSTCVGFCTGTASYGSDIEQVEQTMIFSFTYGLTLPTATSISFVPSNVLLQPGFALTVRVNNVAFTAFTITQSSNSMVTLLLSTTIPANAVVETTWTNTMFAARTSMGDMINVMRVRYSDVRIGGDLEYQYPALIVQEYPYFDTMSLAVDVLTGTSCNVQIKLRVDRYLAAETALVLKLEGFGYTGDTASFADSLVDSASLLDLNQVSIDVANELVTLVLRRRLDASETIDIEIHNITPPPAGLQTNEDSIQYAVDLGRTSNLITPFAPFMAVESYTRMSFSSASFTFATNSIVDLTAITISVKVTSGADVGDILQINLPSVTSNLIALQNLPSSVGSDCLVTWTESSKLMELEMLVAFPSFINITIDTTNREMQIVPEGIQANTLFSSLLVDSGGDLRAIKDSHLPCIGICSALLTGDVRITDRPTTYTLRMSWGTFGFNPDDKVEFTLPGFSTSITAVYDIACQDLDTNRLGLFQIQWTSASHLLTLQYPTAVVANYTREIFNMECIIHQAYSLKSPVTGVRHGSRFSANMYYYSTGPAVANVVNTVLNVDTIGYATVSSMVLAPVLPNTPVSFDINFVFSDLLTTGDIVYVYLPDFDAPSRPLPIELTGSVLVEVNSTSEITMNVLNVDKSVYQDRMISYLTIELMQDLLAGNTLGFSIASTAGIRSPLSGVFQRPLPWFAVRSSSSPIAGSAFKALTKIGTLNPSTFQVTALPANITTSTPATVELHLEFFTACPILPNDEIAIMTPHIVPADNAVTPTITLSGWNASSTLVLNTATFDLTYSPTDTMVTVKLLTGYIMSGKVEFFVTFNNVVLSNDVVYENDPRLTYSFNSPTCPIEANPFSVSNANFMREAEVEFLPVDSVNGNLALTVHLHPIVPLVTGDTLFLVLYNVTYDEACVGNTCVVPLLVDTHSSAIANTVSITSNEVDGTSLLAIEIVGDIPLTAAGIQLSFSTARSAIAGFRPFTDHRGMPIAAFVTLQRNNAVSFVGPIIKITKAPFVVQSTVSIATPVAGSASDYDIHFTMSSELTPQNQIQLHLPGFSKDSSSSNVWNYVSADAVQQFRLQWLPLTDTLLITPILNVPAQEEARISISASRMLQTSSIGFPNAQGSGSISLYLNGQLVVVQDIDAITVVPFVVNSQLGFLNSDEFAAFAFGGDYHAIQLEPGHELSTGDIGELIVIDGTRYTISNYANDILFLRERYEGRRVILGSPAIELYSSPFRYAEYLRGTGTDKLIFRYKVARGDSGSSITLYSSTIDLNNGKLLRASQRPVVIANLLLPAILQGVGRVIDTSIAVVQSISTTSPAGVFGEGQFVEFTVRFSKDVVVFHQTFDPTNQPSLLLNLVSSGLQHADYYYGSGTRDITFLYQVKDYDYETHITSGILAATSTFYQPLRFIVGFAQGYLRRRADVPLLDANLDLISAAFNFQNDPHFIGSTAKVIKLAIDTSDVASSDLLYFPGDYIRILVVFDRNIRLEFPDNTNTTLPYFLLDVGRDEPGIASFAEIVNSTTLVFQYLVTLTDSLTADGLLLHCTCEDFLRRTFIYPNGTLFESSNIHLSASLLIASGPSVADRRIEQAAMISTVAPQVVSVSTNASNALYGVGDSILINVKYDAAVYVDKLITLHLKGQSSFCRAPFYDGNGTDTLRFIYHVSYASGTARLDCDAIDSIDTSAGTIYKLASVPTLITDNDLPLPGSETALGRRHAVIVDTTPGAIRSIQVEESNAHSVAILASNTLSYNVVQDKFSDLFQSCGCEMLMNNANYSAAHVNRLAAKDYRLLLNQAVPSDATVEYTRHFLQQAYGEAVPTLPPWIPTCFNWWNALQVSPSVEFVMQLNRNSRAEGLYVELNTGYHLNRAQLQRRAKSFQFGIVPMTLPATDRFFAFRYGGRVTRCISLSTSGDKGEASLLEKLNELPELAQLYPSIHRVASDSLVQYTIAFHEHLKYDLELLVQDALVNICANAAGSEEVYRIHHNDVLSMKYDIQFENSLLMEAKDDLSPGEYSFNIVGPRLDEFGLEANSFVSKHISSAGEVVGNSRARNNAVTRMVKSALTFSREHPGNLSFVYIDICGHQDFLVHDTIEVYLPSFDSVNSQPFSFVVDNGDLDWDPVRSVVRIEVTADTSCISTRHGEEGLNMTLPFRAIYRNDQDFTFIMNSTSNGVVRGATFQHVKPIGLAAMRLSLSDPRAYLPTKLHLFFETRLELQPGNETIELYLPGFYSSDSVKTDIELEGGLNDHFEARWSNHSYTMYISPLRRVPAGVYNITLISANFQIIAPPQGISSADPPAVRVSDPFWKFGVTEMEEYPITYGYQQIDAEVSVNGSHIVDSLRLAIQSSRDILGPAIMTIQIPALTHRYGYFGQFNTSMFDSAEWFDFNKTWVIRSETGWDAASSVVFSFTSHMADFHVNEHGIHPYPKPEGTWAIYAVDGNLEPCPFTFSTPIPTIRNVSVVLQHLEQDVFYSGLETISVDFDTNYPHAVGDVFYLKFDGNMEFDFTDAKVDDICYVIAGHSFLNSETILEIAPSNISVTCKYQLYYSVSIKISDVMVLQATKHIRQFDVPHVSMAWSNPQLTTAYAYARRSPWLGIYSSSLDLAYPYQGEYSDATLRVLTATPLSAGSSIFLVLPGMKTTDIPFALPDGQGRNWVLTFHNLNQTVMLRCPVDIPASALTFALAGNASLRMPLRGIEFYDHAEQQIGLQRGNKVILSQPLSTITPVGVIKQSVLKLVRDLNCESSSCHTVVGLRLALDTRSPLAADDVIHISFNAVKFAFPTKLDLAHVAEQRMMEVRTVAENEIIVKIFEKQYDTELSLEIVPSVMVQLLPKETLDLSYTIDIESFMNPVHNYVDIMTSTILRQPNGTISIETVQDVSIYSILSAYSAPTSNFSRLAWTMSSQFNISKDSTILVDLSEYMEPVSNSIDSLRFFSDQSADWTFSWDGTMSIFVLTAKKDILPGTQEIEVFTDQLLLIQDVVYGSEDNIAYAIYDAVNAIVTDVGFFRQLASQGLVSSSIDFASPTPNALTEVQLQFVFVAPTNVGDMITVQLPGFVKESAGALAHTSSSPVTLVWMAGTPQVSITVTQVVSSLEVTLLASNKLRTPTAGVNQYYNSPKLALNISTNVFRYSDFQAVTEINADISVAIAYSIARGGAWVDLQVSLTSAALFFHEDDEIVLLLPQFATSVIDLTITSNEGSFIAEWHACSEELHIIATEWFVATGPLQLVVGKLQLPPHGVPHHLAQAIEASSSQSIGGERTCTISSVEEVAFVASSSIAFEDPLIGQPSELVVDFVLSVPIAIGDVVTMALPGALTAGTCVVVPDLGIDWTPSLQLASHTLTLEAQGAVVAWTHIQFHVSGCVAIPAEGFPPVLHPADTHTISFESQFESIDPTAISDVVFVGVQKAVVHYDVDDISQALALRLELQFTTDVEIGDTLLITVPYANATKSVDVLELYGDRAEDELQSYFDGSYDVATSTIALTSIRAVSRRILTVFVARENGLMLKTVDHNVHHVLSATVAKLGTVVAREIEFAPKRISELREPKILTTTCNGTLFCEYTVSFTLADTLPKGDFISFGHPNIHLPAFREMNFSQPRNEFHLWWRKADDVDQLKIESSAVQAEHGLGGYLEVASDFDALLFDNTLPAFQESLNLSVATVTPRVRSIALTTPWDALFPGDIVEVQVSWTKPVVVMHPAATKLLLNTGELAAYISGSGSPVLRFRYIVANPRNVAALAVAGAGALEVATMANIVDATRLHIPANSTFQQPFEFEVANNFGVLVPIGVTKTNTATVIRVETYSTPFTWYSNGDVLDVAVVFNRPITVQNAPELQLEIDGPYTRTAKYVSVRKTQVLKFNSVGYIQLGFNDQFTSCLLSTDIHGIAEALKALPGLNVSLPLHVERIADEHQVVFEVKFHGVAPALLTTYSASCDDRTFGTVTELPEDAYKAVFRYTVQGTDPSGNISYVASNALSYPSSTDKIIVRHNHLNKLVDKSLPDVDSFGGLLHTSMVSINNRAPYIVSISSDFTANNGGAAAVNGDTIYIAVEMSAPVAVQGTVSLPIQLTNSLQPSVVYKEATLHRVEWNVLIFKYFVEMGDAAPRLDTTASPSALQLDSSSASIRRLSSIPTIDATLTLILPQNTHGLYGSNVVVDATALPRIMRAYVDEPVSQLTAGSSVLVHLEFSTNITVVSTNADFPPSVEFVQPTNGRMVYQAGSGLRTLDFLYTVKKDEPSSNTVTFRFELEQGHCIDTLNHQFVNLTDIYTVQGLGVDTSVPTAIKVDCDCADGVFYPGEEFEVYVEFDKAVYVLGSGPFAIELFVFTQIDQELLAFYSKGNGTTKLYFTYIVPPVNKFIHKQGLLQVDYAGTAAIQKHIGNVLLTDVSPHPQTHANLMLPTLDFSFLKYQRKVFVDFTNAYVVRTFAVREGTYTVGDTVRITVEFSSKVMLFIPSPYLLLSLNDRDVIAHYVSGNYSKYLQFAYKVVEGDQANQLDYVDTKRSPYFTSSLDYVYPLTSFDNYAAKFFDTPIAEIFMASQHARIHVATRFPPPGAVGSLAASTQVAVNTMPPVVLSVTSTIPTGTYGHGTTIPIIVEFSAPVVVQGCPYILFIVNNKKRHATYVSGSGSAFLSFTYQILPDEYKANLDYYDSYSLIASSCSLADEYAGGFISRKSEDPTLPANLLLPSPYDTQSVVTTKSIVGNRVMITVAGTGSKPITVFSNREAASEYSFGDAIALYVKFSGNVSVQESLLQLKLQDLSLSTAYRTAKFTTQVSANTLQFEVIAGAYDSNNWLTFQDRFSMYSGTSCGFRDPVLGKCLMQALPDVDAAGNASLDFLTRKHLRIVPSYNTAKIVNMRFLNVQLQPQTTFHTADRVLVELTFSLPVEVHAQPIIVLQLNAAEHIRLQFYGQSDNRTILFSHVLTTLAFDGPLACGKGCFLYFEQGSIVRATNFLSVVEVDKALPHRACENATCESMSASTVAHVPSVHRVYTNSTGVIRLNEYIYVFVEFTTPVRYVGNVVLVLDLPNPPAVPAIDMASRTTLMFRHRVAGGEYTSALDYLNVTSLQVADDDVDAGIFADSDDIQHAANLMLPLRGGKGSLGIESRVIIDQSRPNIFSATTVPVNTTTCGDLLLVTLVYSQPMVLTRVVPTAPLSAVYLGLSLQPNDANLDAQVLKAQLVSAVDNTIQFQYYISNNVSVGDLSLAGRSPLATTGWSYVSALNGIPGPDVWDNEILAGFKLSVVKRIPYVKRVFSYNASTDYFYGAGDRIVVYVEYSAGVRVEGNLTLALSIGVASRLAKYFAASADNTVLMFEYEIVGDDNTETLEYVDQYALQGSVFQISSCEVPVPANLLLPPTFSEGSLGYCCRVIINSIAPYVSSLFPVKLDGMYGANETILIVARFTKPVIVYGEPYIELSTGHNLVRQAHYTTAYDYFDLTMSIGQEDVVFEYIVQEDDNIDSLCHAGSDAIHLPTNAYILQRSDRPIFAADLTLREPGDFTIVDGKVERQWKYRFPQKIEVFVRDLAHNQPESLTFTAEHGGAKNIIFRNSCANAQFGQTDSALFTTGSVSNRYYAAGSNTAGEDLLFGDSESKNIAPMGLASQSSTSAGRATFAIDGEYSPVIGDGHVTETLPENNSWWKLTLLGDTEVETIRIYERKPQRWVVPEVQFVIKGLDRYPQGFFKLNISNVDAYNPDRFIITNYIPMRPTEYELKTKLEESGDIGNVDVVRMVLPFCDPNGGGCGESVDQGFGDSYKISFNSVKLAAPVIQIVSVRFPGQPLEEALTPTNETSEYLISTRVEVTRIGRYMSIDKEYMGNEIDSSKTNVWLTPFYVFVFSSEFNRTADNSVYVPTALNESIAKALWYARYTTIDEVLTITLPRVYTKVFAIKIQRDGYGPLSLTEVEVFSRALNTLSYYRRGSPVQSYDLGKPYQPELPFALSFGATKYDGRWLLEIDQTAESTGNGAVGEVIVVITDFAGVVRTYYQDVKSIVTSLPRFGRLFATTAGTYLRYNAWQDKFGLLTGQQLVPYVDQVRSLGYCYSGSEAGGDCIWQQGGAVFAPPQIAPRVLGDIPSVALALRNERVVYYVPAAYYTGQDFFTYQTYNGLTLEPERTVDIVVDVCRKVLNFQEVEYFQMLDLLCDCAPSAFSILGNDLEQCELSRAQLCSDARLRGHFTAMCDACFGDVTQVYNATDDSLIEGNVDNTRLESTACRAESVRMVSIMQMRGLCVPAVGYVETNDNRTVTVNSRGISDGETYCLAPELMTSTMSWLKKRTVFLGHEALHHS